MACGQTITTTSNDNLFQTISWRWFCRTTNSTLCLECRDVYVCNGADVPLSSAAVPLSESHRLRRRMLTPPLFQPLRFRSRRIPQGCNVLRGAVIEKRVRRLPLHAFTVKGGFVNTAGGQRRMIIAGKIFKRRER